MAPETELAEGGTIIAGGRGPVKGIRMAGVVIGYASSYCEGLGKDERGVD
jgi:hypothetical protein